MDLTKIFAMLGIDKLDESKQDEIKTKLADTVQLKIDEGVKAKEEELKQSLTEHYEEKFETYKNDITEKFSDFVDNVIDEELEIPQEIVEYAKIGKKYQAIIEQFKAMLAIDEDMIDQEAKKLLAEAKDEIETKEDEYNKLVAENMELKKDAKEFAAQLYLEEKCKELTEAQAEKAKRLLEGITDKDEIDRKLEIIVESKDDEKEEDLDKKLEEEETTDDEQNLNEDEDKGIMSIWANVLSSKK